MKIDHSEELEKLRVKTKIARQRGGQSILFNTSTNPFILFSSEGASMFPPPETGPVFLTLWSEYSRRDAV